MDVRVNVDSWGLLPCWCGDGEKWMTWADVLEAGHGFGTCVVLFLLEGTLEKDEFRMKKWRVCIWEWWHWATSETPLLRKGSWIWGSEVQRRGWGQIHKPGNQLPVNGAVEQMALPGKGYRMRRQGAGDAEVMCKNSRLRTLPKSWVSPAYQNLDGVSWASVFLLVLEMAHSPQGVSAPPFLWKQRIWHMVRASWN